jgi:hypothetical protein
VVAAIDDDSTLPVDAYQIARTPWASEGNATQTNLLVAYSDAFQPPSYWNGVFPASTVASNIALDHVRSAA